MLVRNISRRCNLEIDPRGVEMNIYEKEGGGGGSRPLRGCGGILTRVFFVFDSLRLLLVHSQGLCTEYRILNLEAIKKIVVSCLHRVSSM